MHNKQIVHRDLKPSNLLYKDESKESVIKISDFGLARILPNNESMFTQCGTPGFVAPEISLGKGYDYSVDYWSLGVIMYVMICGYEPFFEENEENYIKAIRRGKIDFNTQEWVQASDSSKQLIRDLLNPDPVQRIKGANILQHKWMKESQFSENLVNLNEKSKKEKLKLLTNKK